MNARTAARWPTATLAVMMILLLSACDAHQPGPAGPAGVTPMEPPEGAAKDMVSFNDDAGADALANQRRIWRAAIKTLLENPDSEHLARAGSAWDGLYTAFNDHYLSLATSACQRGAPERLERLDDWPFYPAYVDALPAWPDSGIVNDPALELTAANLRRQQGATADGEVALGFQPLHLLLMGVPDAPRQAAAFLAGHPAGTVSANTVEGEAAVQVDAPARRRDYLRLASEQLAADLDALIDNTATDADSLRCALRVLDRRLARLERQRDATDPEGGLYLPARSIELIDASQPRMALSQLTANDNAALRDALDDRWPGFLTALEQARDSDDWAPLRAWLGPTADGPSPTSAVRG